MAGTSQFTIGTKTSCSDGPVGKLCRVIVDPIAEKVTHLVVEPEHRRDPNRLVPLDVVDAGADGIQLRCSRAEFEKLEAAEENQFIPATTGYEGYGYGPGQMGYWPYYGHGGGMGVAGLGMGGGMGVGGGVPAHTVTSDTLPLGEVDVRRGDPVHATDGEIGRVQGLVIDRGSCHVTHVLLQLDPLPRSGDVNQRLAESGDLVNHLLVGVVEHLVRVLGRVERLVSLGRDDVVGSLEQAHEPVFLSG